MKVFVKVASFAAMMMVSAKAIAQQPTAPKPEYELTAKQEKTVNRADRQGA